LCVSEGTDKRDRGANNRRQGGSWERLSGMNVGNEIEYRPKSGGVRKVGPEKLAAWLDWQIESAIRNGELPAAARGVRAAGQAANRRSWKTAGTSPGREAIGSFGMAIDRVIER